MEIQWLARILLILIDPSAGPFTSLENQASGWIEWALPLSAQFDQSFAKKEDKKTIFLLSALLCIYSA